MKQPKVPIKNVGFGLHDAIQFNRDCIKQQLKNRHSGYHACTVLKMLEKRTIITISEIVDLRTLDLAGLAERIIGQISHLQPATQKVYINTAKHAIEKFLHWKTVIQDQSANADS